MDRGADEKALLAALAAGIVEIVVASFTVASWFAWLIEINDWREGRSSAASGDIIGRQGLVLAEAALAAAGSLAAVLVLRLNEARPLVAGVAAVLRLLATLALVALYWNVGWYYILEAGAAKLMLAAGVAQVAAFGVAAFHRPAGKAGTPDRDTAAPAGGRAQ